MVKETVSVYTECDDGTHYLLNFVKRNENNMKMKKLFKTLMAMALAVVLSNVGAAVEKAEAATCPPHGSYEVCVNVRCGKCGNRMGTYYYRPKEGEEMHSYCAVG